MSARSLLLSVLLAACSKSAASPEADPEKVVALAKNMARNVPLPAGIRTCKYEEVVGAGATLTRHTLLQLGNETIEKRPENEEWVNPAELDSPAARELIDPNSAPDLRRRAAAELLSAPYFLIYWIDLVDEPLALGVKDFKKGTVGARALRYDHNGRLQCVQVFLWGADPAKRQWAIAKTNLPAVSAEVKQGMQQDVRAQLLLRVAGLGAPPPARDKNEPADDRNERQ